MAGVAAMQIAFEVHVIMSIFHAVSNKLLVASAGGLLLLGCHAGGVNTAPADASVTADSRIALDARGTDAPRGDAPTVETYNWNLPTYYPTPLVPADNPMTNAKVELGRRLFYDTRLSFNDTTSCGSCHEQAKGFTDGRARSIGASGQLHPRSAQGLANVGYFARFGWGNPNLDSLEKLILIPLFGETPVELGMAGREPELLRKLSEVPLYQQLFAQAFPNEATPITVDHLVKAIASFVRSMVTYRSPNDRYVFEGDDAALSESAKRGKFFFTENCSGFCHVSNNIVESDASTLTIGQFAPVFHVNAIYNLDSNGLYPIGGQGAFEFTGLENDMGRFRSPSLKNIALTAPYFHDGSAATLDDVIDHYAAGGRTITVNGNVSVGSANPRREVFGFQISPQQRADLHAFFDALTDSQFLTDPRFSNPWL